MLAKLPEWEAVAKQEDALACRSTPAEMSATYRAQFTQQPDGSIFVEGDKAKGTYRIAAPIPLDRVTGIRLEALADDGCPSRGPGRSGSGNFVVTEFTARWLPAAGPQKLVRSWDFSGADDDWQTEDGAKVVADSGMRHVFGNGQPVGIKTSLKEPAGLYLVEDRHRRSIGRDVHGAMDDRQSSRRSTTPLGAPRARGRRRRPRRHADRDSSRCAS